MPDDRKPGWEYGVLWAILALIALVGWTRAAWGADPECITPLAYDPAVHGQLDARTSVRFCTPTADVDNNALQDGDLTRCVVSLAAQVFAITSSNRPGQYVNFTTPDSVKQAASTGAVEVFCETGAGAGAPAVALNARFRDAGTPGVPTLLR
jgi:hypothetical protein